MNASRLFQYAALAALLAILPARAAGPAIGQAAPNFTLTDTNGVSHTLSSLKGKTVVLEWVNHGCPFVQKHYGSGNMQKLQRAATAEGVVWFSICSSASGKQGNMMPTKWNETTRAQNAAPTAVLLDTDGTVGHLYHATNTPDMVVIDAGGKVAYSGAIDSIASTDQDDIKKATNYVTAALADLKAGRPVAVSTTKPYGCSVKY